MKIILKFYPHMEHVHVSKQKRRLNFHSDEKRLLNLKTFLRICLFFFFNGKRERESDESQQTISNNIHKK